MLKFGNSRGRLSYVTLCYSPKIRHESMTKNSRESFKFALVDHIVVFKVKINY